MTKARKVRKPTDPAEIGRRAAEERERQRHPENWGVNTSTLKLEAFEDVIVAKDLRARVTRAQHYDVFALLYGRRSTSQAAHDAVRRFSRDLAIRCQLCGSEGGSSSGGIAGISDAAIDAAKRVEAILVQVGPTHGALLLSLLIPAMTRGERVKWRAVVERVTGLYEPRSQSAAVVGAAEALAHGYGQIDRMPSRPVREVEARAA